MDQPQGELSFDRAETQESGAQAVSCAACRRTIADVYYEAGGAVFCEPCKQSAELGRAGGFALGRLFAALALGVGAAAVSAAVWYGIVRLTGYELGIVAIAVGFAVGAAVRAGSGDRGGLPYQALAVALTYLAIAAAYVPLVLDGIREEAAADAAVDPDAPPALLTAIVIAVMLPVLQVREGTGIIGALIVGFALYQAWKMNRRSSLEFAGPFRLGAARPA